MPSKPVFVLHITAESLNQHQAPVKSLLSDNQSVLEPAPMNLDFLLQSYPFGHASQRQASMEQGLLFGNLYAVFLLELRQKMVRLSMSQGIHWNIPVAGSSLSTLDKSGCDPCPIQRYAISEKEQTC